jgi:cyclohexyl-isocyanide hydratase
MTMRWLFHVTRASDLMWDEGGRYRPASLAAEGFIHASYKDCALESARLYFAGTPEAELVVLAIDPRRLDARVEVASTSRGRMPHVHGSIPRDATTILPLETLAAHADGVTGTRIGFAAFAGMTLLDLVGPLDALSRIATMGFDPTTTCEVFTLGDTPVPWAAAGATLSVARQRPPLSEFDVLVLPGGFGARDVAKDDGVAAYLATFPENRLLATVCTGALLAGAAGRLKGKRATTHRSALDALSGFGAAAVEARLVDEGQLVTSGGVTAGIDLGLFILRRLAGDEVAAVVAAQMEVWD